MAVNLALQLREGTKKAHTMAENTGFVSCFLKGVVDKASYRTLVGDLWFVYSAMEEEIGKLADHAVVGPIAFSQLNRRSALEQDLADALGLRVQLADRGGKGELTITYGNLEQLDDLTRRLNKPA